MNRFLISFLFGSIVLVAALEAEISISPQENFAGDDMHVVAAFIKAGDKVLFMKVAPHKWHANKWAIPGGKVKSGETLEEAVAREVKEETSLELDYRFLETVYIRSEYSDFVYHMYEASVPGIEVDIPLTSEHTDLAWWTLEEALQQSLMADEAECIRLAYPEQT